MRRYLMTALAVLLLSGLTPVDRLQQRADALSAPTAEPATGEPGSVDGLPDASMLADLAVHAQEVAANPPPEPLPFDAHSAETAMQAADFASDHGITEQDATQRLRWQYESQALTDQLPIVLGDAYAGHWFDHDDGGRLKIAVAADPVPPALVASLRQHGTQSFTDVVQVANSLRDLSTTATHLLIAVNDVEPTIDVGMRPSANAVVLKVPADVPDRTIDSIRSRRPAAFDRHVVPNGALDRLPSRPAAGGSRPSTPWST